LADGKAATKVDNSVEPMAAMKVVMLVVHLDAYLAALKVVMSVEKSVGTKAVMRAAMKVDQMAGE
jgi:hypothetical protein